MDSNKAADSAFTAPPCGELGKPSGKLIIGTFDSLRSATEAHKRALVARDEAREALKGKQQVLDEAAQSLQVARDSLDRLVMDAAQVPTTYREYKRGRDWIEAISEDDSKHK